MLGDVKVVSINIFFVLSRGIKKIKHIESYFNIPSRQPDLHRKNIQYASSNIIQRLMLRYVRVGSL